jgi:hypothetical protein
MVEAWKELEIVLFNTRGKYLYGYVGLDDHMMEPLLLPGSLVLIDPVRRMVKTNGWRNEFERPIYFIETRAGYLCAWCTLEQKSLILQPYPLSPCAPAIYRFPEEGEVVGQVIGSVMRLGGY